jgi:serum/glucocorticoid-regulated kinase 2
MRFVPGGQLRTHLRQVERFSEQRAKNYVAQLALCLGHLHSKNIVYRDLKLENVLLGEDGYLNLIDFGICRRLEANEVAKSVCGTSEYFAPEMLKEEGHSYPLDWWTLGIATYEMLVGFTPFYSGIHDKKNKKMKEMILKKDVTFPIMRKHGYELSKDAKDFISKLLSKDPKKRLGTKKGVDELFKHKWLADVDRSKVVAKELSIAETEKP